MVQVVAAEAAVPSGPSRGYWLLTGLLGASILAVALLGGAEVLSLRDLKRTAERELAAQRSQAAADSAEGETPGAASAPPPDLVALREQYQAVRAADRAVDVAIARWAKVSGTEFSVVTTAMEACYHRADDYLRATAPYQQADLSGVVPAQIDLRNAATDCGRSALRRISGPIT